MPMKVLPCWWNPRNKPNPKNPITTMILKNILAMATLLAASTVSQAIDVVRENNQWKAKWADGTIIPCEDNFFRALEAAVKALPDTRTSKLTINVLAGNNSTYLVTGGPANFRDESNFIIDFGRSRANYKFQLQGGGFIHAGRCHNMELRNLQILGEYEKIAIKTWSSNNVYFENIHVKATNSSIGIRPEGAANQYASNIQVRGYNTFEGLSAGNHGIETDWIGDFHVTGLVETWNTGGCGILLNHTRSAYIKRLEAEYASYNPQSITNYAALRLANECGIGGTITIDHVLALNCGRGFVVTTSPEIGQVNLKSIVAHNSANWGVHLSYNAKNITIANADIRYSLLDGLKCADTTNNCQFNNIDIYDNERRGINLESNTRNLNFNDVQVWRNGLSSGYYATNLGTVINSHLSN